MSILVVPLPAAISDAPVRNADRVGSTIAVWRRSG